MPMPPPTMPPTAGDATMSSFAPPPTNGSASWGFMPPPTMPVSGAFPPTRGIPPGGGLPPMPTTSTGGVGSEGSVLGPMFAVQPGQEDRSRGAPAHMAQHPYHDPFAG